MTELQRNEAKKEETMKEISELQMKLTIAIENHDLTYAHELEIEIDTLQQNYSRLNTRA